MNHRILLVIFIFIFTIDLLAETGTMTGNDGKTYQTVKIGDQWWMAENLRETQFRNGDPIYEATDNSTWTSAGETELRCAYDNNESTANTYGYLYNWYAVNYFGNIAPSGWHVPSTTEWNTLETYLGGFEVAGGKLKETSTSHWDTPNTGATDEVGFTALPAGIRSSASGGFFYLGWYGYFWTSTSYSSSSAWCRYLYFENTELSGYTGNKNSGYSVRLVKDDDSLPVSLSSFTALVDQNSIILQWVTESEVNNLGFILERKECSNSDWQTIASYLTHDNLKGKGNSSSRIEYQLIDNDITAGNQYGYRLSDVDFLENVHIYDVIFIQIDNIQNVETSIEQAYPNPFNPVVKFKYTLEENSTIHLHIVDVQGKHVKTLYQGFQSQGVYNMYWDSTNDQNYKMPSGCYFIILENENLFKAQKILLLK